MARNRLGLEGVNLQELWRLAGTVAIHIENDQVIAFTVKGHEINGGGIFIGVQISRQRDGVMQFILGQIQQDQCRVGLAHDQSQVVGVIT